MAPVLSSPDALVALDTCDAALDKLEKRCCEPGRSPSMRELGETLAAARSGLNRLEESTAEDVLTTLEDAGAQVGRLQVGCCAPNRLPLYVDLLEGLTKAQLAINDSLGRGH